MNKKNIKFNKIIVKNARNLCNVILDYKYEFTKRNPTNQIRFHVRRDQLRKSQRIGYSYNQYIQRKIKRDS